MPQTQRADNVVGSVCVRVFATMTLRRGVPEFLVTTGITQTHFPLPNIRRTSGIRIAATKRTRTRRHTFGDGDSGACGISNMR